jgi:CHAT domain-containing protein/Tfp pilus assembly protein PilF
VCGATAHHDLPVAIAQTAAVQTTSPIRGFAESLALITDLLDRGRGIEAENVARALLARVESIRGPDALEVAQVLDLLWRAVRRSSKVTNEEKQEIVERAATIKEKALGPAHPDLATSLINLGVQRALAGDPAAGKTPVERALAIREAAFGPDHALVAAALQTLGGLLITLHDDEAAKVLLERAQRIREAVYGEYDPDTVRTLVNLAILYQETGDYITARQRYERALAICEGFRSTDLRTLNVLTGVSIVLSELGGDFAGSARLNERLLALSERTYGPTDPRLRTPLENLAMDLRDLGDYTAAKPLAERSLAIAEHAFGRKHAEVARSLYTLATISAGLGDYAEAMRLFEGATRINEEVLRPSNPEIARASWFIRDLIPLSGYGADEMDLFERALASREKNGGLRDPRTAESLSRLAAVLSSPDDFKRTRPLFERALQSQEQFLGPDHPEVAASATNLAYVLSRIGDYEAARPLYERALNISEKSLGTDHPKVATALVNLARLHMRTGNYDEVAPLLARALAIQVKGLGPEHPDIAVTLSSQAELMARAGNTVEAFAIAARAEALVREHLRLTARTLPERQALAYASSLPFALDVMLRLASTRPRDREMAAAAWNAVIGGRGVVLDEIATRHRAATADESPRNAELATSLALARQRLAALAIRGIRNDAPERYRQLLEQARTDKDRAERALAESSAIFREDQSKSRILLPAVTDALPADSALVGFVRYGSEAAEEAYLAFVLRAGGGIPVGVPIGAAARIDALVVQWRQQIRQEAMAAGRDSRRGEAAYRRVADELRQVIWDPLLTHLSNVTRVFVVPDGALHLVSFAALPTATTQYLIETGPSIHYLSAERDLVSTATGPTAGDGLVALGAPAFDEFSSTSVASAASFRGTRSGCGDFQSMRFDPLPASLKEVDEVVSLWNKARRTDEVPVRLVGTAASESAFKSAATGHRILHLATHGFFLGSRCGSALSPSTSSSGASKIVRENPLLLSGLILAGANRRNEVSTDQDDGVLTAEEVAALNLSGVEWAVLSGCDTGVGEVRAGEGVFGLRRAFQVAGAKSVIMSLWPVEDETTSRWMSRLYEGRLIRELPTADAVNQASLALLHRQRAKGLSTHPFHWTGFVAAGDWR